MMTDEEFATILDLGYETPGIEFKGPGPSSDKNLFAQVVRAVLGMANRRDGGRVVIGVDCRKNLINGIGLLDSQLASWNYDDVASKLASYSDPSVIFDLQVKNHGGKNYILLEVDEFSNLPILCNKDYPGILRKGACYVRSRKKPETTEIPSQEDMRDLLDLAIEKGLRKYVGTAHKAGVFLTPVSEVPGTPPADTGEELYSKELGDLA